MHRYVEESPRGAGRAGGRGFTLVEVLIVIGVIAVLIGILLPVMNVARAQAKAIACQSNLRQVGTAFLMYFGAERNRIFTGSIELPTLATRTEGLNWWWWYDYTTMVNPHHIDRGYLRPYLPKLNDLQCPLAVEHPEWSRYALKLPSGTCMSWGINELLRGPLPMTKVRVPSETFLLTETGSAGSDGANYIQGMMPRWNYQPPDKWEWFHGRHRGRGSVFWLDGHVSQPAANMTSEETRWRETNRRHNLGCLTPDGVKVGDPDTDYYFWINKAQRR